MQNVFIWQVLCALCIVSINRYCIVMCKNKVFFQTIKWAVICISGQCISTILLLTPIFVSNPASCLVVGLELGYRIYLFIITIIIPSITFIITNSIIFVHVRRSTRLVQPFNSKGIQSSILSIRDVRLLKHIVFMFVIFFTGWIPIYVVRIFNGTSIAFSPVLHNILGTLPILALLVTIIDLFSFNHELQKYFTRQPLIRQMISLRKLYMSVPNMETIENLYTTESLYLPLKILVLPEFHQNVKDLKRKAKTLLKTLKDVATFHFANNTQLYHSTNDRKLCKSAGPFNGILGFAEGASLGGIISGLQPLGNISFNFVILISGLASRIEAYQDLMKSMYIKNISSLHIYGTKDGSSNNERTLQLAASFENSKIIMHRGSRFTSKTWPYTEIKEFLLEQQKFFRRN
ncbi:hypothetical protein I4U23_003840 [Adineta vaga]|nr:hypothetical protein I4U23_003840 [Adineta vaga]